MRECLDSLINQTFPKDMFEIVLVLNGCDSPWKEKIEKYISENEELKKITFIHTLSPGVSNARNIALNKAKGEFIIFVDDDDYVSPFFLEELYKIASPETISLCYPYAFMDKVPDKQVTYRITEVYERYSPKGVLPFLKARQFFSGPCMKLIHRDIIRERRFDVKLSNGEDSLFMFLISNKFKYVSFTSKKAIYYRRLRQNSAISNLKTRKAIIGNSLYLLKEYCKIYLRNPFQYSFSFFSIRVLTSIRSLIT